MSNSCAIENKSVNKQFVKYVSQNIFGMIGLSAYLLVDTFFISSLAGANGITALNLVLPVYSLIFAIGSMIAIGSATRYTIAKAKGDDIADKYLFNAIFFAVLFSLPFILTGIFIPDKLLSLLGANAEIITAGCDYTQTFLLFAPFFMLNYIINAFVRNDSAPSLSMTATISCSMFNIVMDYILMFPCKMGMTGAALATGLSPIVGIIVCSLHFFSKNNNIKIRISAPSFVTLFRACQLGFHAFIGELSSGITTMIFNILILSAAGNIGVAAYGVIANTALVATSIFNGISQGSQPLLSRFYGKGDKRSVNKIFRNAVITSVSAAIILIAAVILTAPQIVDIFNSEQNADMAEYAVPGIKIYFLGFIFAGFNIVSTGYLSATEKAAGAFCSSITRGLLAIVLCAFILSLLFGLTGIWTAFCAAEFITSIIVVLFLKQSKKQML